MAGVHYVSLFQVLKFLYAVSISASIVVVNFRTNVSNLMHSRISPDVLEGRSLLDIATSFGVCIVTCHSRTLKLGRCVMVEIFLYSGDRSFNFNISELVAAIILALDKVRSIRKKLSAVKLSLT
jgi:hypothetical protein